MQVQIMDAVSKLEKIYDRTYTDTFGALKTQIDAMQKYIFSSTVGDTNVSEPKKIRFFILGVIHQFDTIDFDEICNQMTDFKKPDIIQSLYLIQQEGLIEFDGKIIKNKGKQIQTIKIEGDGI